MGGPGSEPTPAAASDGATAVAPSDRERSPAGVLRDGLRAGGIVLVPGLLVVALFVYWAANEAGYAPTTWLPSALAVLGLLAATLAGMTLDRLQLSRPAAIALVALAGYTVLSYVSIAWASAPGDALDGANRTLLYLLLFALFAVLPWRAWTAAVALSAFALGVGVVGVVTLAGLGAPSSLDSFSDGRLTAPLGYVNGSAALFMTQALVATALAARRELPVVLRGPLLGLATASLSLAVLCASRGWLFALPPVLLAAALLVPDRTRLLLWSLAPAAGTLVALPALLDVFERTDAARGAPAATQALLDAAGHASDVALAVSLGVLAVGLVLAAVDRRASAPPGVARATRVAVTALAAVAVVGGIVVAGVTTDGRPDRALAKYWDDSAGYRGADPGSSRFTAVGTNRPDFWRVSWAAFREHPIGGLGQDNWRDYYLRHRRTTEQPRWAHSLELRLLAHTGIAGLLLFGAFLAAALVAALPRRRRAGPLGAAIVGTALLPLTVWVVHGSIDWFWELPALSGPAFAFLGLGARLGRPVPTAPGPDDEPARRPPRARAARGAAGLGLAMCGVLATVALLLPYLSARDAATAGENWRDDPARALARLDRAADLNPLSPDPPLAAAVIALGAHAPDIARERATTAVERHPGDWFARLVQGLAASAAGDPAGARRSYGHARALNPGEPLLRTALRRVDGPRPLEAGVALDAIRRHIERVDSGR